ncbi:MAG: precorrin-6A/cobalt-precorrin-6A reductase, partial [Lachnospiraceae bacterium]|nr:precorrin-6A/cobalt-precorrin-6A reductase [Lachnospiraceae bacterium]
MVGKIIIFGGTTEGKELAFALSDAGFDITVSVATDLGLQELTNAALGHLPLALKARKKGRGEKEMA